MHGVAAATPAHRFLREQTRDAHEAAEATAGMRWLMGEALDESAYEAVLGAKLELFRAWETGRGEWLLSIREQWGYASRVTSLEADLCRSAPCARPVARKARSYSDTAGWGEARSCSDAVCWGELYVIEGSSLGARVIVKHLHAMLPSHPHHFYAMGETSPTDWRRFQSVLDAALPDDDARHDALTGARSMFARFQQTLQDAVAHV
ncbi:biliverdin-producing heme oxygenase [Luteibacter anthropi]|uniref:biliverdin-producing heme oxygenase n=1 Tax=Luteibacter anthropi TaxID=564369 RepID=UPI0020323FFF|nr:biliverdin-producing heme oxygenase [Luteibacter anthropi]URX62799.1 biliverdin-producing heme oxygenase [Luteibacter anthropi]